MSPRKRLNEALCRLKIDRVPIISVFQTVILELMGITGIWWPEAHFRSAEEMARLAESAYEYVGFECLRVPFSLVVEAESFGCAIDWGEKNQFPRASPSTKSLDELSHFNPDAKDSSIPIVIESVRMLKVKYCDSIPIIAALTGPFTMANLIRGPSRLCKDMATNPKLTKQFLWNISEFLMTYARQLQMKGADVFTIMEYSGNGKAIGPSNFQDYVMPYLNTLSEAIENPLILHIPHDPETISPFIRSIAKNRSNFGFCIEWGVDIAKTRANFGENIALIGNVDPINTLLKGNSKLIVKKAKEVTESGIDIISPGCDLQLNTPLEKLRLFIDTIKKQNTACFRSLGNRSMIKSNANNGS